MRLLCSCVQQNVYMRLLCSCVQQNVYMRLLYSCVQQNVYRSLLPAICLMGEGFGSCFSNNLSPALIHIAGHFVPVLFHSL